MSQSPSPIRSEYGFLWWLNTDRTQYPSAAATGLLAVGAGAQVLWIDPRLDLVMVLRWIDKASIDEAIGAVMSALR